MEKIQNKRILIVGATGGIGSQTARLLAQNGAHLFLTGRNTQKLQALATELNIPQAYFAGDLSSPEVALQLQEEYFNTYETIDVLINAAGIGIIKPLEQLESDDFIQTLQSNLITPFNLLKAFLPAMKTQKTGLIIQLPGVLGKTPMAGAAAYAASKYGLNGLMKSVREELKRTEVRITNLYLGGTDTPFWDTIDLRVQRDKFVLAQEAARTIWFLCQQPSSGVVSEMVLQPFNHQAI